MPQNNSNLLFIIPGFFFIEEYQKLLYYNDIPLGTLQLSSFLKEKAKIITNIIDLRVEADNEKNLGVLVPNEDKFKQSFLRVLEQNNIQDFHNIGINCYTSFQFLYTDFVANIIKKEFPEKNIIVGGYHPTAVPEDFKYKNSPYDFVIKGESELVLLDLFKSNKLQKKGNNHKPQILNSEILIDVNSLPFPDYELYLQQYPFKNKFKFELYNSRGCPYQCAFCADNFQFQNYNFDNFKKNFQKVCELVEEYNPDFLKIGFSDQSFNSLEIKEKILDYILSNNLNETFTFSCQSRVEAVSENPKLIDMFKKCKIVVGYGFEHANELLLKEMHKTENAKEYIQNCKKIMDYYKDQNEIYCRLNILVGFPGETKETFNETIQFIEKYALHDNIQISPTFFSNYPNVFVYKNMEYYEKKWGTEFIKDWWNISSNPFKNAVPIKSSKKYPLKEILEDYIENYIQILKIFKRQAFSELISWKKFFIKWSKELSI